MEGHHTPEQVQKAFGKAPEILHELVEAGVKLPRFELFEDASGSLILGREGEITNEQYNLASKLIYSRRPDMQSNQISIAFCCGLVTAAEKDGG